MNAAIANFIFSSGNIIMNVWTEHRNPEGRTYWFNTTTKQSVWEKPDDLKTPFERALGQTKWKEYFSNGRKYYYNTDTKESKWDMPDELLLLLEKVEKEGKDNRVAGAPNALPAPVAVASGALVAANGAGAPGSPFQPPQNGANTLAVGQHTGGLPMAVTTSLPARPNLGDDPVIPHNGYQSLEEGEKAFTHLLKKAGVDATWTWDQTMRAIITDPLYKALNTLAEKKAAWQKYVDQLKAKEQEEKDARLAKLRPAIRNMLKGNPNVFHYTTFATADKLFSQHPIWQQARIESERKLIFEEYVAELKERDVQETRAARSRSISKLVSLFKDLGVEVTTRWRKAHEMVLESEEWKNDLELQKLPSLDILLAFEDYSRVKEREFDEQLRRSQIEKTRRERKAREAFKALLQELVADGKIKARSKWKNMYPLFSSDDRYLDLLGNPGSNPLELFWDVVDQLDQVLDTKLVTINAAIDKHNDKLTSTSSGDADAEEGQTKAAFSVGVDTTFDEFIKVIKEIDSIELKDFTEETFQEAFETLRDQAIKRQNEERKKAERRQRHLQDDLRYALKKLPDPIDINLSYESAVPLMEHLPEFKAVDEDGRRAAFDKYVKRQKERMRETNSEDGGSVTGRKRKEPPRDTSTYESERARERSGRERERDRDRDAYRDHERWDDSRRSRYSESHRSSRDYSRADYTKERDREHDRSHRSSKHHRDYDYRDYERDERRRYDYPPRDWDEPPLERSRSVSYYHDDPRRAEPYDDRVYDEKRARYDREDNRSAMDVDNATPPTAPVREETPEEGEI